MAVAYSSTSNAVGPSKAGNRVDSGAASAGPETLRLRLKRPSAVAAASAVGSEGEEVGSGTEEGSEVAIGEGSVEEEEVSGIEVGSGEGSRPEGVEASEGTGSAEEEDHHDSTIEDHLAAVEGTEATATASAVHLLRPEAATRNVAPASVFPPAAADHLDLLEEEGSVRPGEGGDPEAGSVTVQVPVLAVPAEASEDRRRLRDR